jgi:hypothetical protein
VDLCIAAGFGGGCGVQDAQEVPERAVEEGWWKEIWGMNVVKECVVVVVVVVVVSKDEVVVEEEAVVETVKVVLDLV